MVEPKQHAGNFASVAWAIGDGDGDADPCLLSCAQSLCVTDCCACHAYRKPAQELTFPMFVDFGLSQAQGQPLRSRADAAREDDEGVFVSLGEQQP